jgi:type VI protein secretion system component VasF
MTVPDGPATALREDIARTRAQLGTTVQALASRADVPARVRHAAHHTGERLRVAARTPTPWLALGTGAAALLAIVLLSRSRRA